MSQYESVRNYILNNAEYDEKNGEVIELISAYFADDMVFEEKGYSLDKGLFLSGSIGCGKTYLMKLMQENRRCPYYVKNCREIASQFATGGDEAIERYVRPDRYAPRKYNTCFDDLGTESDKKYYGSDVNVMLDILLRRYDKYEFTRTHITTNLSAEELKKRYGTRLTSRFKEMFNFINFPETATDRRR